jgi:hypothetical protein
MRIICLLFPFIIAAQGQYPNNFADYLFSKKEFRLSLEVNQKNFITSKNDTLYNKILITLDTLKTYSEAISFIENNSKNCQHLFYFKVKNNNFDSNYCDCLDQNNKNILSNLNLTKIDNQEFTYLNPSIYTVYSALVPGLGKALSGNIQEGFGAFYNTVLTAYLAYYYFERYGSESKTAYLYSTLAASFYIGNIYGTYIYVSNKNINNLNQYKVNIVMSLKLQL